MPQEFPTVSLDIAKRECVAYYLWYYQANIRLPIIIKPAVQEVYEKRTVSAVHLHYIDKKILSVPEEDCELDKVYVGLQLELKSEEDQSLWKHCTRISGDPIFPAIQVSK